MNWVLSPMFFNFKRKGSNKVKRMSRLGFGNTQFCSNFGLHNRFKVCGRVLSIISSIFLYQQCFFNVNFVNNFNIPYGVANSISKCNYFHNKCAIQLALVKHLYLSHFCFFGNSMLKKGFGSLRFLDPLDEGWFSEVIWKEIHTICKIMLVSFSRCSTPAVGE